MLIIYSKWTKQDDLLKKNGILCVLKNVVSCKRSMKENGIYEISVKCTINEDVLSNVQALNLVQTEFDNQFYIIYWYQYNTGTRTVDFKARHIFYWLSSRLVLPEKGSIDNYACYWAINAVMEDKSDGPNESSLYYNFSFNSDIDTLAKAELANKSKAYAIVGDANSIVNQWNGKLYRDNFYFSVKSKMENSKENAFLIRDNFNTTGIEVTFDDSERITKVNAEDNYGTTASKWLYNQPYQIIRYQKYSYSGQSTLTDDAFTYFDEYSSTKVSYKVNFERIRRSGSSEWLDLESYNVGDSGTIFTESLGLTTTQRIISQEYDIIMDRVESIELCQAQDSTLYADRYSKLIASDNSPSRRLDRIEKELEGKISRDDINNLFGG